MKWLHFTSPMFTNKNGKVRDSEVWMSCKEMIADSGRSKGIRMMDMTISIVKGSFFQPKEMLYLHFKNQKPSQGICVGHISEHEEG